MSEIKKYIETKEYIVTLKKFDDLEQFYKEIETKGLGTDVVPKRDVYCTEKRPISRNTSYLLTDWEADELRTDSRVESVTLHPRYLGITAGELSTKTQSSSNWNKSSSTTNTMLNFGLLRCYEGEDRPNWGSNGTTNQTGTVKLDSTGKNVDVVIVDGDKIVIGHPEYAENADGSGGTRFVQYNWFQHDPQVKGTAPGTYVYTGAVSDHATHVAATVAGSTQGWARDANIYNIFYFAGANGDLNFPYVMDYVREFHRTKSVNPEIGRKNPTITNNSWGMSIFPSEWSFSDITAVTYRGVRYTPSGEIQYTGFSGVCSSNELLASLQGLENHGNRITTTGPYVPPGGDILTSPPSWTVEGNQTYLTTFSEPDSQYEITIQGPADINVIHNVATEAFAGTISLGGSIQVFEGAEPISEFSQGPFTGIDGNAIEIDIRERISLANNSVYTIKFNTNLNLESAVNPIIAVAMSLTIESESQAAAATVTTITNSLLGAASLTPSTTPTQGNNDDGWWELALPFNISYLGTSYSSVYVGTNSYLTFGGGSTTYISISATTPNLPKIVWGGADNSVQRIYSGVEGVAPNRTFRIRIEGNASTSGILGSPNMVSEYTFYENNPSQIDLQLGQTNRKNLSGGFTTQQLNEWGFVSGARIPARVPALDADIIDAIDEGILYVGAAGNGSWKHDLPEGLDWDNTFEMANRYPGSVTNPYYYMRGSSPTANDINMPNISVGSIDVVVGDRKATYSDCGPGVDIYAPGTNIISADTVGSTDSRNSSFRLGKKSGTSMASPQVCGVLACALEQNPHWNQIQAKEYILSIAKENQIITSNGGPADLRDLQGSANLYLYYERTRPDTGVTIPKLAQGKRPSTGQAWPRPKIYRFGPAPQ
jgi:hypothetical protein